MNRPVHPPFARAPDLTVSEQPLLKYPASFSAAAPHQTRTSADTLGILSPSKYTHPTL